MIKTELTRDAETTHAARTAHTSIYDGVFRLDARGGSLAGEAMKEIFERFCEAEFDKDWAWTQEHHGSRACGSLMPRTDAQRRFDALGALFDAAVSVPPGSVGPDPVVMVIGDQDTFATALARAFGLEPIDPSTVPISQRYCQTSTGHSVSASELAAAAIVGHVQRVVLDSASVPIDMGRRSRLFTGSARLAALFLKPTCLWPGCELPAARCETDHHREWNASGTTSPGNGGPLCRRHNRFKHRHGYHIARGPTGVYHVTRPDGTQLE